MDLNSILTGLFEKLSGFSKERPHAGQKYRLMGITAEFVYVIRQLRTEVLTRVSQEAPIDVDIDIDFSEMAERALQAELPGNLEGWQSDKTLAEMLAETEVRGRLDANDAEAITSAFAAMDSLSMPELVQVVNETRDAEQDITIESGKEYDILTDEDLILTLKLSEGDILIKSITLKVPELPGDLNHDGKVNAADLVKAITTGKTQAEIDEIVNSIMNKE